MQKQRAVEEARKAALSAANMFQTDVLSMSASMRQQQPAQASVSPVSCNPS